VPHSCQVKAVSPALFCWYSAVVLTDQSRALQPFSAAVSPHTGRWAFLAAPCRTGASHRRSAHSTVANLDTSSLRPKLLTQAVLLSVTSTHTPIPTLRKLWFHPLTGKVHHTMKLLSVARRRLCYTSCDCLATMSGVSMSAVLRSRLATTP